MGTYFKDLNEALISTMKGMSVTLKHLLSKPVTVQYPDERLPIADGYLGKHELEQSNCTACNQCIKICPVDCLEQESVRHGKVIEFSSFIVDYNYCMFCGLCVEACPTQGLKMTKEYDLSQENRADCITDLLSWKGLRPEDIEAIEKARIAKEKKKKAAAEKKAKEKEKPDADEEKEEKPDKDKKNESEGKPSSDESGS